MTTNVDVAMDEVMVRRARTEDGGRIRALRLEMLADTPLAFITTLAEAAAMPHHEAIARVTRGSWGTQTGHFVAVHGKRIVGQVLAQASRTDPHVTMLFAIYVAPAYRGGQVLSDLIEASAAWSRECGRPHLELEVVTGNRRAARAYTKLGFAPLGEPVPHPVFRPLTEQGMYRQA